MSAIRNLKSVLRISAPQVYRRIRPLYTRWNSYGRLSHDIGLSLNWSVERGPFARLKYLPGGAGPPFAPKLVGSYRQELHPFLEEAIARKPALVVNIGSAEGYYVVGMAMRLPQSRVIAFEAQSQLRQACSFMAERNVVQSRVAVRGACSTDKLRLALSRTDGLSLIISDCEGEEKRLLDPVSVPALERALIIVELHDSLIPGVTEQLLDRFQKTHHLQIIQQTPRRVSDWPVLEYFSSRQGELALDESRAQPDGTPIAQTWMWMTPRVTESQNIPL